MELFGRLFLEDVGAEPSSVLAELGRFDVNETKFRREMERLRNSSQRDLNIEVNISSFFCCFVCLLVFSIVCSFVHSSVPSVRS